MGDRGGVLEEGIAIGTAITNIWSAGKTYPY